MLLNAINIKAAQKVWAFWRTIGNWNFHCLVKHCIQILSLPQVSFLTNFLQKIFEPSFSSRLVWKTFIIAWFPWTSEIVVFTNLKNFLNWWLLSLTCEARTSCKRSYVRTAVQCSVRTTPLSYGNTQKPAPWNFNVSIHQRVGDRSDSAKFCRNPAARGRSAYTCNRCFWEFSCEPNFLFSLPRLQVEPLSRFARLRAQRKLYGPRKCLWKFHCKPNLFRGFSLPKNPDGLFYGKPRYVVSFLVCRELDLLNFDMYRYESFSGRKQVCCLFPFRYASA